MNATPDALAKKLNSLAVTILQFNKLRGRLPEVQILVVEGTEDPIFYSAIVGRLQIEGCDYFFVANGKENSLGLREHLRLSKEMPKGGGTLFFVDRDFDGLKGRVPGADIYVTPTYSIENIVVCKRALRHLLLTQFRLINSDGIGDVEGIMARYDTLIEQHKIELKDANRIIHFIRSRRLAGEKYTDGSISSVPWKFADLDRATLTVKKTASGNQLNELVSLCKPIEPAKLQELSANFESLDSHRDWRGKFVFYLFRQFVGALVEDRNNKTPRYFSSGSGRVSLDTSTNSFFGLLSSVCDIPPCLSDFLLAANKPPVRQI